MQFELSQHGRRWRRKGSYMKTTKDKKSESPPDEVELVVTQQNYDAGLKRGWTDDDMLKPGRYKFKRGGFLARHPELKRIQLEFWTAFKKHMEDISNIRIQSPAPQNW